MDEKDLQLYQEENRTLLIKMGSGIDTLASKLDELITKYEPPVSKVDVSGTVEVNTEKQIEVTNLQELKDSVKDLGDELKKAISENSYKPVSEVSITNLEKHPTELKISNWGDLKGFIDSIREAVANNQPVVNVEKQDFVFPTDPRQPIAVRLSDGKSFYNAITTAMTGGISLAGIATDSKLDEVITAVESIGEATKYVTLIDETTTTDVTYIGKAVPTGSAISTSSAVWQITRIDESSSPTTIKYADGNLLFDNTFTSLAGKTYN